MSGSLTHSPADIVRKLLIDLGLGTTPSAAGAWPVHTAHEPNEPDSAITVIGASPRDNGRVMIDGERQEKPGFQVRVRDANYSNGATKARAIAIALDESVNLTSVTIGSSVYLVQSISRTSGILPFGEEKPESRRSIFTINAVASLRQTT